MPTQVSQPIVFRLRSSVASQAWAKDVGWRIDYQIATAEFARRATAASVWKSSRFSDHAPLVVDYDHPA